jgi:predicted DCC family thiol-disulfide oxidoreductase YuxK
MASNGALIRDDAESPSRFYACVRIVIGVVALGATTRYLIKATAYEDTGFESWHAAAMLVWAILAVAVVLGWRARVAAVAATITGAVMVTAGAEFFNNNHMYLATICMGLVAFSDCERFYALRPRAGLPDEWPRWMMRIQLSVVYGYAGLQKVNSEFLSGDALDAYMSQAVGPLAPLAHALSGSAIVVPMAYSVVLVEVGMALLVWSKRTRPLVFATAIPLHIAMWLVPYNTIEFLGVVLFAILTFTLLSAWVDAVPRARLVVWDDTCTFCRRFVTAVQRVDAWGALRWQGSSSPSAYDGTGVTPEAAALALQLVEPDGRVLSGFAAVRGIAAVTPLGFLIAPWLALAPVARAGEAVYRRVAARRTCAVDLPHAEAA